MENLFVKVGHDAADVGYPNEDVESGGAVGYNVKVVGRGLDSRSIGGFFDEGGTGGAGLARRGGFFFRARGVANFFRGWGGGCSWLTWERRVGTVRVKWLRKAWASVVVVKDWWTAPEKWTTSAWAAGQEV
jgi:hypothetical protein